MKDIQIIKDKLLNMGKGNLLFQGELHQHHFLKHIKIILTVLW